MQLTVAVCGILLGDWKKSGWISVDMYVSIKFSRSSKKSPVPQPSVTDSCEM